MIGFRIEYDGRPLGGKARRILGTYTFWLLGRNIREKESVKI